MQDDQTYTVVKNHEEQYSIWPSSKALPGGWTKLAVEGSREVCLAHIESVWIDMRPLSLRQSMEDQDF
ncbi:MAG: MbtH family NRPS accessory protein [Bacteroidota bacterium]